MSVPHEDEYVAYVAATTVTASHLWPDLWLNDTTLIARGGDSEFSICDTSTLRCSDLMQGGSTGAGGVVVFGGG